MHCGLVVLVARVARVLRLERLRAIRRAHQAAVAVVDCQGAAQPMLADQVLRGLVLARAARVQAGQEATWASTVRVAVEAPLQAARAPLAASAATARAAADRADRLPLRALAATVAVASSALFPRGEP